MKKICNWVFGSFFRTLGRVFVYLLLGFILSYFLKYIDIDITSLLFDKVYAMPLKTDFYFRGTLMSNSTRIYTGGGENLNISIRTNNNSIIDDNRYQYGFIALCSAAGSLNDRRIINFGSSIVTEMSVVNSRYGCNIYGTDAYASRSRTIYITFKIPDNRWNCSVQGGTCAWNSNIDMYIKQESGATNEWTLLAYGFRETAYDYSFSEDSYNSQNDTIINNGKETNDLIKDDNTTQAENKASEFFNNFTTNTHGLTGIITAPLNAIQSLSNSTCSPLELPLPFVNETLTLPCMRPIYEEHFGSFMNLYDIITLGIISYWVMVRIFSLVKDFKNPDHDEIEVVDL